MVLVVVANGLHYLLFEIYLTINSGVIIAIGAITKNHYDSLDKLEVSRLILVFIISLVGLVLSDAWRDIADDNINWQFFFTEKLSEIESSINIKELSLYTDILKKTGGNPTLPNDVLAVNKRVAMFFIYLWIFMLFEKVKI